MTLPLPLVLTGFALLLVCGGAALLLTRIQATATTLARARLVLDPYRGDGAARKFMPRTLLERMPVAGPRLASLFGINLKRSAGYPIHWGLVLVGTFVAARATTALVALVGDTPEWLPVPLAWVVFSRMVFASFASRRRDQLYRQFPDALGMMVRSLRVGQTVTQALRGVARDAQAPTNNEFDRLADRLAIGVPLSEALFEMAGESGLTEYRFFATTLILQDQTGGSLTEALDGLADVIRGRVMLRRRGYALAGEARTSAIVLGVLPIFTGAVLAFVAPDYVRLLIDDPTGRRVLGAAIFMLLLGSLMMKNMIGKILR